MIEYSTLSDWYVEPWFITCNNDVVTLTIQNTVHIEQTVDCILKLYALFYRVPFIVGMTLTSLAEVP